MTEMLAVTDLPTTEEAYFGPNADSESILFHLERGLVVSVGTPIVLCVGWSAVDGMMRKGEFRQAAKYAYMLDGLLGCLTYPRTKTVRCLVLSTCYVGPSEVMKAPRLKNGYYLLRGSYVTVELLKKCSATIQNWAK